MPYDTSSIRGVCQAGIGAQHKALKNIGVPHEIVATSDFDINATASYAAIHIGKENMKDYAKSLTEDQLNSRLLRLGVSSDGKEPLTEAKIKRLSLTKKQTIYNNFANTKNMGSIVGIDPNKVPDCDLFTYSFPCQQISVSGSQKGLAKGSGTSSSLLWECQKIIEAKMPKYLLMENVKNLVSKKFKPFFDEWCEYLEGLGYTNYWQVLNAKDYGVSQNRDRVFVVSILGEHEPYEFPEPQPLTKRLKDYLDDEVDEKYYLAEEKVQQLLVNIGGEPDLKKQVVGTCHPHNDLSRSTRERVYSSQMLCPTITATTYKDPVKVIGVN